MFLPYASWSIGPLSHHISSRSWTLRSHLHEPSRQSNGQRLAWTGIHICIYIYIDHYIILYIIIWTDDLNWPAYVFRCVKVTRKVWSLDRSPSFTQLHPIPGGAEGENKEQISGSTRSQQLIWREADPWIYPLVICYIAMEAMAHRSRWFSQLETRNLHL